MSGRATAWRRMPATLLLALVVIATLSLTKSLLAPWLTDHARDEALAPLREILAGLAFDNDPLAEASTVIDSRLGPGPQQVYPIRLRSVQHATVVTATASEGYGGALALLIAIATDGHIIGVRVRRHGETAGIGDAYTRADADWLRGFSGRSLHDPPPPRWRVRRDGGDFDHVTGATITPRAIVTAVRRALEWHTADSAR